MCVKRIFWFENYFIHKMLHTKKLKTLSLFIKTIFDKFYTDKNYR